MGKCCVRGVEGPRQRLANLFDAFGCTADHGAPIKRAYVPTHIPGEPTKSAEHDGVRLGTEIGSN
jgi:hypothetical protein